MSQQEQNHEQTEPRELSLEEMDQLAGGAKESRNKQAAEENDK